MGNLEKLGILVIVILVVVVGVVAMTPKSTVDERLYPEHQQAADATTPPETLESVPADVKKEDVWPAPKDGAAPAGSTALTGLETASSDPKNPAAAAPTFRTVKVQANDTLASIAKRETGNAANYKEIQDANPGLVPSKLKAGMEIKIPIALSTAKSATAPAGGSTAPATVPPATTSETSGRVYIVKAGDTLSSIATRELGSKNWAALAKANEDVLHGTTALKPGMKLTIPTGTAAAPTVASRDPAPASASSGTTSGEREYVVKAGDSLWGIAKSEMGGESFVKDLRAANEDVLHGSTSLKVGMKLKIPGKK
jgi:nucleoid-associated protein YgaU